MKSGILTQKKPNMRRCVLLLVGAAIIFATTSCSDWFQDKVELNGSKLAIENMLGAGTVANATINYTLEPTTQLLVSQGKYTDRIELTWTPVKNADSYRVERQRVLKSTADTKDFEIEFNDSDEDNYSVFETPKCAYTDKIEGSAKTEEQAKKNIFDKYDYYYYYRVTPKNDMNSKYENDSATTADVLPVRDESGNELPLFESRDNNGTPITQRQEGDFMITVATLTEGNSIGYLFPRPTTAEASKAKKISQEKLGGYSMDPYQEIGVHWDKVAGASSYIVLRADNKKGNGAITCLSDDNTEYIKSTYYVDNSATPGKEYYYSIKAVKGSERSVGTAWVGPGQVKQDGAPEPPTKDTNGKKGVVVLNGYADASNGAINLQWEAVTGAKEGTTVTYIVYRKSSKDNFSSIDKIKEIDQPSGADDKTIVSCSDSTVKKGYAYIYLVVTKYTTPPKNPGDEETVMTSAYSETDFTTLDSNGSEISNPDKAVAFLVSPTAELSVDDAKDEHENKKPGRVLISWLPAVGTEYLDSTKHFTYDIYWDDEQNGPYTNHVASGVVGELKEGYLTYECESHNFFKIKTVGPTGAFSEASAPAAPSPDAPADVQASKTADICKYLPEVNSMESAPVNKNGVYPVVITWKMPQNPSVTPAKFTIQRSDKKGSSYKTIQKDIVVGDAAYMKGDTYYYVDINDSAKVETYYYYKVFSKNTLGGGKNSNEYGKTAFDTAEEQKTRGYGALTREQWFREFDKTTVSSHAKMEHLNKKSSLDKLGSDTTRGAVSGNVSYNAKMSGLGARIIIYFDNYCDAYIKKNQLINAVGNNYSASRYFVCTGNTNTSASMDESGTMDGTVNVIGMYPGSCCFDHLKVKGGDAGGGTYPVATRDLDGNTILSAKDIPWNTAK